MSQLVIKGHTNAQDLDIGSDLWPCWCLRAVLLPELWQSEWPALPSVAMVISRLRFCWGSCLGLWFCYSQGLCWCPLPMLTQGPLWTKSVEVWGECWASSILTGPGKADPAITGELCSFGKVGPICHHGCGRAGYAPCLRKMVPAGQTDQLSFHAGKYPGLWIATAQHLSNLWCDGVREGTDPDLHDAEGQQDIWEEFGEGPILWYTRSQKPWT